MLKVRGLVPLAVTLLVIAGAIGLFGFSSTLNPIDALLGRGRVVTVPDFTGRALPGAENEAIDLGLEPSTTTAFSLSAPRGSIMGQDPASGERARAGDPIEFVVSSGANRIEMPVAVGLPLDQVTPPLEDAGVPIETTKVASDTVPEGIVVSQEPAAGVQVTGDDVVKLGVSSGADERPVPEILGLSIEGAAFQLGEARLLLGTVSQVDDPAAPAGAVVSTVPAPGTVVPKDSPIAVTISNGPAMVPVPDVTNNLEAPARAKLEAAGFVVDVAGRLVATGDPGKGNVFEQSPAAGAPWRPGQVVTIVVGREPPPPRTTTTTTSTIPTTTVPATTTTRRPGN